LFNIDFFLQNDFSHQIIENKKILSSSIQPFVHLNVDEADEVVAIFETILLEKNSEHANKYEMIALKIAELLILSERLFDHELGFNKDELPEFEDHQTFLSYQSGFRP
jgi:hypothetical protein